MAKNVTRMVTYARDPKSRGADKFADLATLIASAKRSNLTAVLVASPRVLGDTYEELVENLDALAAADLAVMIVPPGHR